MQREATVNQDRGLSRLRDSKGYAGLEYLSGLLTLFLDAVRALLRPPFAWRRAFVEECWLMVRRCALPLAITTFAAGVGTEGFNGGGLAREIGVLDRFGTGYAIAGLREFAPFLSGLVMAGVVGTAVCADLGARKVREELDAIAVLGVDPIAQLVAPRFLAFIVVTPMMAFFAFATNILGGLFVFGVFYDVPLSVFLGSFPIQLTSVDVLIGNLLKCAIYGTVIATVFSYEGMNASGGSEGVGRAVNRAVVIVFVAIFVLNFALNSIVLASFPILQQAK